MNQLFLTILNMSLTASYCIIAVIVLRFVLHKQSKLFSYLLWSVVLFRLLCPFSLSSSYSLLRVDTDIFSENNIARWSVGNTDPIAAVANIDIAPADQVGNTEIPETAVLPDAVEAESLTWAGKVVHTAAWVWAAGMLLFICYSAVTAFALYRSLKRAVGIGGNRYEAEGIASPFVFGIIQPRIYLPAHLQEEEKKYVLEHETVHIARKDYLVKLLAYGAVCIHWFNPLVWLAFILMEKDMEMSCDEAVLKKMGEDVKKEYSMALLTLSVERSLLPGAPLAFGEGKVKGRVNNILSYHKRALPIVVMVAVCLIAVGAGLLLNPIQDVLAEEDDVIIARTAPAALMDMIEDYATAFGNRDGAAVVDFYIDEETALENVYLLEKEEDGGYTMGVSSPMVDSFRYELHPEENTADIYYYTWVSDPHMYVWKEKIEYVWIEGAKEESEEYKITGSSLQFMYNISTGEEFEEAYLISGNHYFADFEEMGFVDAINFQRESGSSATDNTVYETPERAAESILNLEGGEGIVEGNYSYQAVVRYRFADGSEVDIPMYDANRVDSSGVPKNVSGQTVPVWVVDTKVWNAKAP